MSCLHYYYYSSSCLAMTQMFRPSREGALLLKQQSDVLRVVPHYVYVLIHISIVLHDCKRPYIRMGQI